MYIPVLTQWGEKVSTRPAYHQLAQAIKKVKKEVAGSHPAMDALIQTLRQNNPRKPAFLEELNTIDKEPTKRGKK